MNAARLGAVALLSLGLSAGVAFGQGILKNKGTFRNTGTATYTSVQNYKGGVGGTILNSGSLTTTTTVDNDDAGTGQGTIRNYIGGVAAGTLTVGTDLQNDGGTVLNDSLTYVPVLAVGGAITSSGTFDTDAGKVVYNGAGAQNIFTTAYGALVAGGSGAKTLLATVTVNDSSRIMDGSTLAVSTFQLDLKGAANVLAPTGTFSASSGTVRYNGDLNQTMIPGTYKTLTLTGSSAPRTKSSAGGISFAASGALTVDANDTLYVSSGTLDLATNTPSLTNSEAIKVDGAATFHGGITNAGTFFYASSGAQSIGAVTYSDLIVSGDGTKTFPSGTVAVTGNYVINSGVGSRDYTTNSNTFSFAGTSGTQSITGLTETFYVLDFSGAAAKSLAGSTMGAARMDISSGSGVVTNDVTTVTLTNIANTSLTLAAGTSLINNATRTITMNGDLDNEGDIYNAGTISVY
jgi:hypothetical protein